MNSRLALLALMTLPLAACDGAGLPGLGGEQQAPVAEGHKGPPGVSPLEQAIETGGETRAVATADAATHNTAAFSARGNEPFWAVDVAGTTAIYKTPDNQRGRAVLVNRLTFAQGVEYVGVLNGRPFTLNIRGTECQDSMSDDKFPMTARLTTSGRSVTGCAGPASAEVAAATAATKAVAPAAPKPRNVPKPAATRPAATPAPAATPTPAATTTPAAPTDAATTPAPTTSSPAVETPAPAASAPVTTPAAPSTPATPAPATTTPAAPAPATTTPATPTVPAPTLQLPTTPPAVSTPAPAAEPAEADAE